MLLSISVVLTCLHCFTAYNQGEITIIFNLNCTKLVLVHIPCFSPTLSTCFLFIEIRGVFLNANWVIPHPYFKPLMNSWWLKAKCLNPYTVCRPSMIRSVPFQPQLLLQFLQSLACSYSYMLCPTTCYIGPLATLVLLNEEHFSLNHKFLFILPYHVFWNTFSKAQNEIICLLDIFVALCYFPIIVVIILLTFVKL